MQFKQYLLFYYFITASNFSLSSENNSQYKSSLTLLLISTACGMCALYNTHKLIKVTHDLSQKLIDYNTPIIEPNNILSRVGRAFFRIQLEPSVKEKTYYANKAILFYSLGIMGFSGSLIIDRINRNH